MSAAAEHLFAELVADYRRRFARLPHTDSRFAEAVDLLWSLFETTRIHASFDLYVSARTDPDLARGLDADARQRRRAEQLPRALSRR